MWWFVVRDRRKTEANNKSNPVRNLTNYDVVRYLRRPWLSWSLLESLFFRFRHLDFFSKIAWVTFMSFIREFIPNQIDGARRKKEVKTKSKNFCVSHHWSNNNKILKENLGLRKTEKNQTGSRLARPRSCKADRDLSS